MPMFHLTVNECYTRQYRVNADTLTRAIKTIKDSEVEPEPGADQFLSLKVLSALKDVTVVKTRKPRGPNKKKKEPQAEIPAPAKPEKKKPGRKKGSKNAPKSNGAALLGKTQAQAVAAEAAE